MSAIFNRKFGIVIHGAINGYSRKILRLLAADNKLHVTVQDYFVKATKEHGWPLGIRTDKGGENKNIGEIMEQKWSGLVRRPYIIGPSVHNQRIERLWVNVGHCLM